MGGHGRRLEGGEQENGRVGRKEENEAILFQILNAEVFIYILK